MAAAQYFDQVQKIYIAFYQRPADAAGLKYWAGEVDKAGGSLAAVINAFAGEAEAQALYGAIDSTTIGDVIDKLYLAMFNRAPDAAGKQFYIDGFNAGTFTAGSIALTVVESAQNADAADLTTINNKLAVANEFTAQVDGRALTDANFGTAPFDVTYAGNADADAARGILKAVTDAASTVLTPAQVADALKTQIADAGDPINVQTFMLTTGVDALVGTDASDIFTGVVSALVAENTLNATDSIDGGAGTDTLKVDLKSNFSGFTGTGKLANVENIELTNATGIARTFDATGVTGAKVYTLDSKQGISLSNLEATGLTVVEKGAQNNVSIGFKTGVILTGTTDAMSLELQGVGAAKTDSVAQVNPKITLAGIEVVGLKSAGAANFVDLSGVTELTTLTITGDQALTVSDVDAKVTKVDASAATGNVTLGLSVGTAAAVTSVKTGSGNDVVTIDAADLQANAVVAGGAGTDILKLNDTATAGSTLQLSQSGFETLQITGVTTGKALTVAGTNTTDLTTVQLDANAVADGAVSLVNMGAGNLTVNVVGGADADQDLTVDNAGTTTANVQVTSKQATAAAATTGTTITSASDVTASSAATAVFTVGKYVTQTGALVATKATSVTLNVESGMNTATTPAELTEFSGVLDVQKATNVTVNAAGKLNAAEIKATAASSAVINTSATASTSKLSLTKATDLQLTAKGDFSALAASTLAAVQSATLSTDGAMVIDTALSDIASLTISGANTKSSFSNNAKAIGGAAMDHGLTVTATGLKAGFTLSGAIASKQAVSITSSGVTGVQTIGNIVGSDVTLTSAGAVGAVTIGTIDAATDAAGTVTVNAKGNIGNIVVGKIGSGANQHKTVSVNVADTLGTVVIGQIVSEGTVTVNAANSLKAVEIGDHTADGIADITAVTGVNVTAGLKALAFDVAIANTATSGAFAGVVNGSIEADTYQFKAANEKADITLTGDMGLGFDAVNVDAIAVTAGATKTVKIDISGLLNYETAALTGGANANTINGGAGVDTIVGGAGADTINGGAGDDIITGAAGRDILSGGAGNDKFVFAAGVADTVAAAASSAGVDWLKDLVLNAGTADTIDLTVTVAGVGTAVSGAINEATFIADIATLAATATKGFVTNTLGIDAAVVTATSGTNSGKSYLIVDLDASDTFTAADFIVEITGSTVTSLTTASFV